MRGTDHAQPRCAASDRPGGPARSAVSTNGPSPCRVSSKPQRSLQPRAPAPRPGAAGRPGAMSYQPLLWDISAPVHASSPVIPATRLRAALGRPASIGQRGEPERPGPCRPHSIACRRRRCHDQRRRRHRRRGAGDRPHRPLPRDPRPGCGPLVEEMAPHRPPSSADLPPRVLLRTCERAVDRWDAQRAPSAPETLSAWPTPACCWWA